MERLLAVLTALPFGLGFALTGDVPPRGEVVFTFADPAIVESSGLVAQDGLFATVNDSGDSARVFAVDPGTGETVGVTTWPAEPFDVEALAPAGEGEVMVADIGDNLGQRDTITVTRVRIGGGDLDAAEASYDLVYPDGPHDAEALLVHPVTGRVFVVAKEFIGGFYAAPEELSETSPNRLRQLGDDMMAIATDGAFFPDGRHFVLRDYSSARFYTYPGLDEIGEIALPDQEQGEGIAVDERGEVYLSSEGQYSDVLHVPLPQRLRSVLHGAEAATDGPTTEPTEDPRQQAPGRPADGEETPERPLWPWLIGAGAGGLIVLVLLRSLRPR